MGRDIVLERMTFDHGDPRLPVNSGTDTIYLLEICFQSSEDGYPYLQGLVLRPSGDRKGQYTRIGIFRVSKTRGPGVPNRTSTDDGELHRLSLSAVPRSNIAFLLPDSQGPRCVGYSFTIFDHVNMDTTIPLYLQRAILKSHALFRDRDGP